MQIILSIQRRLPCVERDKATTCKKVRKRIKKKNQHVVTRQGTQRTVKNKSKRMITSDPTKRHRTKKHGLKTTPHRLLPFNSRHSRPGKHICYRTTPSWAGEETEIKKKKRGSNRGKILLQRRGEGFGIHRPRPTNQIQFQMIAFLLLPSSPDPLSRSSKTSHVVGQPSHSHFTTKDPLFLTFTPRSNCVQLAIPPQQLLCSTSIHLPMLP